MSAFTESVVDFDVLENNDWLAVNQLTVSEGGHNRLVIHPQFRPDRPKAHPQRPRGRRLAGNPLLLKGLLVTRCSARLKPCRGRPLAMSVGQGSSVLALVLLWGCGGGAAAGGEPETGGHRDEPAKVAPSSDEPAAAAPGNGEGKGGAQAAPAGDGADEATTALEGKDLEAVLQILLSDPELLDKLHLKQPGRSPLKLSGDKLPAKLGVIAGSHEVKVVPEPKTKKEAVLVFTKIERTSTQAKLFYRFDIEGVEGRATFALKDGRWDLSANRLIEK